MNREQFIDYCVNQHDIVCNQKYNDTLPYSFHLFAVAQQSNKYSYLLTDRDSVLVELGAWGHDLFEDARKTYNDVRNLNITSSKGTVHYPELSAEVAEIIYACTELRGKSRDERHGPEFYQGLKENSLGLYVKLCDLIANITFGLLTNSGMVKKYRQEFPHFKAELYREEFDVMFSDIEKLLSI